jgi:hypothetical protein
LEDKFVTMHDTENPKFHISVLNSFDYGLL